MEENEILPDPNAPYCHNCGEDDKKNLAYNDQYANGEHWTCKICGESFMRTPDKDEW